METIEEYKKKAKALGDVITPPRRLITQHKPQPAMTRNGANVALALGRLGVSCEFVKRCASYTLTRYDFNIINPLDINKLDRIKKPLETLFKCSVIFEVGKYGASFSIFEEAHPRQTLYFDFCNPCDTCYEGPSPRACVGFSVNNDDIIIDFDKCPHVLIAGATGSGKSCLLNSLICSLMYSTLPDDTAYYMIDPKRVELSAYSSHPSTEFITEVDESIKKLKWFCEYIEITYEAFQKSGVKNIKEYNAQGRRLPESFIIIDELADLMLVSKYEVEAFLVRIAQLGRACGVHLILATQRPTVNVITGLIKANITTRIALQVASVRDSVTILDHKGAESLLGKGDAIIKYPFKVQEERFQSALIENEEIKKIVDYWVNF